MTAALVPQPPSRQELEAMSLADRVALEDALGTAQEVVRQLNDEEIGRLVEAGASLAALAKATGLTNRGVAKRLGRLGLQTVGQVEAGGGNQFPPPTPKWGRAGRPWGRSHGGLRSTRSVA